MAKFLKRGHQKFNQFFLGLLVTLSKNLVKINLKLLPEAVNRHTNRLIQKQKHNLLHSVEVMS